MILDELILENVGTFAGRHSITLTPPSDAKPIVLVGGLNGAGKTTILEAIHLALYGSLAQLSGRRTGSYENYLRGLTHRGTAAGEAAAVELRFHAHLSGEERRYRVRRLWRHTGASVKEILIVTQNDKPAPALASTWSEHIETFLPRGIAGLFFFDGEQIEALADLDRSRQVLTSALAALLGLDLVDRLSTDLSVLRRRRRSDQVPADLAGDIEQRRQAVATLRQQEEETIQTAAALRVQLERAEKRAFERTERYRAAGGDLLDQRDSAELAVKTYRAELSQVEEEIRESLSDAAPFLQVANLLDGLRDQATQEAAAARERVVAEVVASRDAGLLEQLRASKVAAKTLATVEKYLATDREQRHTATSTPAITGLTDAGPIGFLCEVVLPGTTRRLQTLLTRQGEVRARLDEAERVLVAIPAPESLAPLQTARADAEAQLVRAQSDLASAEDRLAAVQRERARADAVYESALDKAAQANLAAHDDQRTIDHIDRVRATLQTLRVEAARRHLDRICGLILDALGQLLRKDKLITGVTIDPDTHTVQLTGVDSHPLPAQALSAGERQLLAVAMLWGLARAAGRPLPIIIDTPLGRLDGSHREHLVERYFPHASHQVILLSTDTEIDEPAYRRIAKHVGRSYRLDFDPATNATTVQRGYFWK